MLSKYRLKTLERQLRHDEGAGEEASPWPADWMTEEEWLEVIGVWEQDPDYAANEPFTRYVWEYRQTIEDYRVIGQPSWDPPAHYLPRLPLNERRRRWRGLNGSTFTGTGCAIYAVVVAALWVHPEDDSPMPAAA